MAKRTWGNKNGGVWTVASNWKGGVVPTTADTAFLGKTKNAITSAADVTVAGLHVTGANELLQLTGGTFTAAVLTNAGDIQVLTGAAAVFGKGGNVISNSLKVDALGGAVTIQNTSLRQGAGATLAADGAGATVTLTSATIDGGKLSTSGGGVIENGDSKSVLNGATAFGAVSNTGTVLVNDGTNLTLDGAIANSGVINVNGATKFTGLLIGASPVSLSGGGTVNLTHDGYIAGIGAGDSLTNVSDTITGTGFIRGPLAITNGAAGVIDAAAGNLTVNNAGATVTNNGLIEATGTGLLGLRAVVVNSSGGGTVSVGAGAKIQVNGATLTGGNLTVDAGGELQTSTVASTIGAGGVVTNAGTIQITNAAPLSVLSSVNNSGAIQVDGSSTFTGLLFGAGVTLTGGGEVHMEPKGYIAGVGAGATLTNFNNTIDGAGIIKSPITITNDAGGVINANQGRLVINTGNTIINDGLVESSGVNGLLLLRNTTIDSSGGGAVVVGKLMQLDNSTVEGGAFTVNAGSRVASLTHASTINLAGNTLANAGTLEGTGGGLTVAGAVSSTGGVLLALNGHLTVTGAVTGTGTGQIFGSGVLEVDGAFNENVRFEGISTGKLVLGDSAAFTSAVGGLSHTGANSIDLLDVAYNAATTTFTYTPNGGNTAGQLNIFQSGVSVAKFTLIGAYSAANIHLASDGGTGTKITDPAPSTSQLVSAMASFGATGGHSVVSTSVLTQVPHMMALAHA